MNRRSLFGLLLAPFVPAVNSVAATAEKVPFLNRVVHWRQITVKDRVPVNYRTLQDEKYDHLIEQMMLEEDRRFHELVDQQLKGKTT